MEKRRTRVSILSSSRVPRLRLRTGRVSGDDHRASRLLKARRQKPASADLATWSGFFASLPARAAGYGYLRDVQGQVLDAWMKRRDTVRDLSIKMNTGTGKTIVGLLILRSALNEAAGPALYVAPDNYLAGQVRKQADRLGLATVDDPESTSYVSGQ